MKRLSISFQIFIFLIIVAFIPVAIMISLKTYEKQQLTMLENSNVQQGRIVASALESQNPGQIDKDFALSILNNMDGRFDSRIRVLDEKGNLLVDSSRLEIDVSEPVTETYLRSDSSLDKDKTETFVYRLFSYPVRKYRKFFKPPRPAYGNADFYTGKTLYDGDEVQAALSGKYGARTRFSSGGQVSVTLYSAIPVQNETQVYGVVLVSRSTYRILQNLYELRVDLGKIFLRSLIVVLLIALFLVFRIVLPIRKLSKQAGECADKKGQVLFTQFSGAKRHDEIGQLSRAFSNLIERLNKRIKFSQAFSSDISHEFKNPLTAIRSSAELLGDSSLTEEQRAQFSNAIIDEVSHLQNLLTGVRNISKIDAGAGIEKNLEKNPLPVNTYLKNIITRINKNYPHTAIDFNSSNDEINMTIPPEYLEIISANLIDNACSFGNKVLVSTALEELKKGKQKFILTVEDNGPGLNENQISKIFNRFYSERNEEQKSSHTGLGLSLVKAVSDSMEGEITVSNSPGLGGACFTFTVLV